MRRHRERLWLVLGDASIRFKTANTNDSRTPLCCQPGAGLVRSYWSPLSQAGQQSPVTVVEFARIPSVVRPLGNSGGFHYPSLERV